MFSNKSLTAPLNNWFVNRIYRPMHYRKMRQLVIKRQAELARLIRLVINFNEQTASSTLLLKIGHVTIASANTLNDTDIKNLTQQAHLLRTLNRHTINYQKL